MTNKIDPTEIKFNRLLCDLFRTELAKQTGEAIRMSDVYTKLKMTKPEDIKLKEAGQRTYEKIGGFSWDMDKYIFDDNYNSLKNKYEHDKSKLLVIDFMENIAPKVPYEGIKKLNVFVKKINDGDVYSRVRDIEGLEKK